MNSVSRFMLKILALWCLLFLWLVVCGHWGVVLPCVTRCCSLYLSTSFSVYPQLGMFGLLETYSLRFRWSIVFNSVFVISWAANFECALKWIWSPHKLKSAHLTLVSNCIVSNSLYGCPKWLLGNYQGAAGISLVMPCSPVIDQLHLVVYNTWTIIGLRLEVSQRATICSLLMRLFVFLTAGKKKQLAKELVIPDEAANG